MKFKCEINDEDIASFAKHFLESYPIARKNLRASWLAPSTSSLFILVFLGIFEKSLGLIIAGVFSFFLLIVILRPYVKKKMIKNFICVTKEVKGVLGVHEFIVVDENFIEKTEGTEIKTSIKDIYDIYETDLYLFIYISPVSAHIIPKREITKDIAKTLINLKTTNSQQDSSM